MSCTLDIRSYDVAEQNLIELEELLAELTEVTDWFSFGINLEIPEARLKEIEKKWDSVENYKREMLTVWMQQAHPSWKAVVIALAGIDMRDLAIKISNKYGAFHYFCLLYPTLPPPLPPPPTSTPQVVYKIG
jgi:hypothetical protein